MNWPSARQFVQRKGGQDIEVTPVRLSARDILDQADLLQNVAAGITFVRTSIDDRDAELVTVREEDEHRYGKQAIDGACYGRQSSARVLGLSEADGEEEIGFEQAGIEAEQ